MPRGWYSRGFWFGWGRGFGNPYPFCRWFPWLPRWWWTGAYGPITPYMLPPAYMSLPKEHEIAFLEEQERLMEEMLSQIKERLEELREGSSMEVSE